MSKNIVKVLDKSFSDMIAGQKMLISSPEKIANYIKKIPLGSSKTIKEMRLDLARDKGADNTCPLTTGIFLRKAIEEHGDDFPFWRVIDEHHPLVKKLEINSKRISKLRLTEGI